MPVIRAQPLFVSAANEMSQLMQYQGDASLPRVRLKIRNRRYSLLRRGVAAIERSLLINLCFLEHAKRESGIGIPVRRGRSAHADGNMPVEIRRTNNAHQLIQRLDRRRPAIQSTASIVVTQDCEHVEISFIQVV